MESFLACCIPNLKFYFFPLKFNCFNFKVNTDSRDERRGERVVREPEQDARLAHAGIADQQQFEQQIVRFFGHGRRRG
jgi:hypothetical protein